jgi:predicted amidohydrolase YtcJ
MKKTVTALSVMILFFCACAKQKADLILRNCEVYTLEESQLWASAVVIQGNKIAAVLDNDNEIEKYISPATEVIDLEGQFVMPGFIDSHVHFAGFAAQQHDVQLMEVGNNSGLMEELQRVAKNVGPGEWITGGDWS